MSSAVIQILGWGACILFLVMQLPQIILMLRTRNVAGVAVWTWIIYTIALAMSATYLYLYNEEKPWPLIWNQGLSAVLSLTQVILYYRFRRPPA